MDPLLNPLILSNIFKQLPLDGKKSFRQVSKLWEDSTLQNWRNNALVKIVEERTETNSIFLLDSDATSKSEGITLQEFVELLKGDTEPYRFSESKPFRSVHLLELPFDCPPCKTKVTDTEVMKDAELTISGAQVNFIFEKIGPTIHHLQLDQSVNNREGRFIDAFKWILLKACVNLKELQIDPFIYPGGDRDEPPHKQKDFFQQKALNLVTLKLAYLSLRSLRGRKYVRDKEAKEFWNIIPNLKNLDLDQSRGAVDLIEQLKQALDSGKFIKLERFKLQCFPSDVTRTNEVELLVEMTSYIKAANPPLTKICLKLNLRKLQNAQDTFKTFLKSCKDTLTSLSVCFYEEEVNNQPGQNEWIAELSGVTLPNLTCLYFLYKHENTDAFEGDRNGTRNFDFGALQGFPKLKKLTVQLYGYEETENEEFGRGRWLTQEELQYDNANKEQCVDDYHGNKFLEDFTFWSFQKFDRDSLKKLAGWMPSIKCLSVGADETTLPVILTAFPELKRLSLLDGSSVSEDTLEEVKKAYPGMEINILDFDQSFAKCEMPEYF